MGWQSCRTSGLDRFALYNRSDELETSVLVGFAEAERQVSRSESKGTIKFRKIFSLVAGIDHPQDVSASI